MLPLKTPEAKPLMPRSEVTLLLTKYSFLHSAKLETFPHIC